MIVQGIIIFEMRTRTDGCLAQMKDLLPFLETFHHGRDPQRRQKLSRKANTRFQAPWSRFESKVIVE